MNTKELCPICGEGHVTNEVEYFQSEYKGQKATLPLQYQLCDTCHSDFAGAKESRLNKRAILAFRKSVDGLLTGAEIVALRKRYCLTQNQAAKLFGGGPVAFSKYENDDVSQSEAMDSLLRLVRRSEVTFWELVTEKGLLNELQITAAINVSEPVISRVHTTNVCVMADFRNEKSRKISSNSFTSSKKLINLRV